MGGGSLRRRALLVALSGAATSRQKEAGLSIREGEGAERLRARVGAQIPNGGLIVIANREPYAHEWDAAGNVVVHQPASGLVTAIEEARLARVAG